MKVNLIDLRKQYQEISEDIEKNVKIVLESTKYIMGENVKNFEIEFSKYLNVKNSISVGNGTDALVIALKALGVTVGDEIITTPFTFFATAEAIVNVGAIPVFVDIKLDTYNIDENKIQEKITNKTKAILPVHIFGQPCNMKVINEIAKKNGIYVIEDACQAIGAKINNDMIGTLSDIACFSFFPTKNLGCAGDGGMIVTNNDKIANLCRGYRVHGSGEKGEVAYNIINNINKKVEEDKCIDNTIYNPLKYYNYFPAYNSRLDEVQATILRIKLKNIEKYTENRIKIAMNYSKKLKNTKYNTPTFIENTRQVFHLYILQSDNRYSVIQKLKEKGIATGIYYPIPMHLQKAFSNLKYKKGDFPNAEYLSERTFAIPMYPELTEQEQDYIINSLLEIDNE